jgi:hypothetical protein
MVRGLRLDWQGHREGSSHRLNPLIRDRPGQQPSRSTPGAVCPAFESAMKLGAPSFVVFEGREPLKLAPEDFHATREANEIFRQARKIIV